MSSLRHGQTRIGFNHENLDGWTINVVGGSEQGRGSVQPGSALLREGDSFLVGLAQSFLVPANSASVVFTDTDLFFDTSDLGSINDAFEASLVGPDGQTLVRSFTPGRDSFFNRTEEIGLATGSGAAETGGEVKIDVPPGGSVPVLVMRDPNFDATRIDVPSVRFAPANARAAGNVMQIRPNDVRFNFPVAQMGVHQGDNFALLSGRLQDGIVFASVAAIAVVGGAALPATSPPGTTKFFVADATADNAFRYGPGGEATGSYALDVIARNSRRAASNAAGDRARVIDGEP